MIPLILITEKFSGATPCKNARAAERPDKLPLVGICKGTAKYKGNLSWMTKLFIIISKKIWRLLDCPARKPFSE